MFIHEVPIFLLVLSGWLVSQQAV